MPNEPKVSARERENDQRRQATEGARRNAGADAPQRNAEQKPVSKGENEDGTFIEQETQNAEKQEALRGNE